MALIPESELIINDDGSVYHLNLRPGDLAEKIITVGDPDRVDIVAKHFDSILFSKQAREFKTTTGRIGKTNISVMSTGIGTDNIDIVLNEIDALFNIDFEQRKIKENLKTLSIVRLGTSGSIQESLPLDSLVVSKMASGLEGLMHMYDYTEQEIEKKFSAALDTILPRGIMAKTITCSDLLLEKFRSDFNPVNTITATGFYAPQGRTIRLAPASKNILESISQIRIEDQMFHNLEMETSGIYGLSKLMGHEALSISAILANRIDQRFSTQPKATVDKMIRAALGLLETL